MNGEYQVSTDTKEKIKLDSDIVEASWVSGAAHGGQNARLKVVTYAVAEGSSIEIKGFSSKGKAPGTIKGQIYNNEFYGDLLVPEKVELGAQIGFEAKLPKHGLKMECSGTIPATPLIQVSKMCWDKTEVHRGDILKLTTQFVNPLPGADAQVIIYEFDPDGHHEKFCSFPVEIQNDKIELKWEFNYNPDTAQIPTEAERQKYQKHYVPIEFFFVVVIDGVRIGEDQESGKLRFKDWAEIELQDEHDQILPNHDTKLVFADGSQQSMKSDTNGLIKITVLSPGNLTTKIPDSVKQTAENTTSPATQDTIIPSGAKSIVKKREAEILFDPATQEFVVVNPSELGEFEKNIKLMDAFKPYLIKLIPDQKIENAKENAAEMAAVFHWMKELADADTQEKELDIIRDLGRRIEEKKTEILHSGNVANVNKLHDADIKHYIRFKENRGVRIKSTKIKPHWRRYELDTENLNEEVKKTQTKEDEARKKLITKDASARIKRYIKKNTSTSAESTLFEKKLLETDATLCDLINRNFFETSTNFDASVSAQLFRAAAESKFGSTVDFKEMKLKVEGKAEASVALGQAKGQFIIYLPDINGADVIGALHDADPRLVAADAKPLFLQLKIVLEGSAFVGAWASAGAELGLQLKESAKQDDAKIAGTDASIDLFVGAKAGADITYSMNMKLIDDVHEVKETTSWDELGSASFGVWVAAGYGIAAAIKVGYWDGHFRYESRIGIVFKAGAGQSIKGTIDPAKIGKFIWTLGTSVNWISMHSILDDNVHDLYQSMMLNCFYTGEKVKTYFDGIGNDLHQVMRDGTQYVQSGLSKLKAIDETFDHLVPGYSGFKRFSKAFWILKGAYDILQVNSSQQLADNALSAVENAHSLKTWNYATWQIKANLLQDIIAGSPMHQSLDAKKESAVMSIFQNTQSTYEITKILNDLKSQNVSFDDSLSPSGKAQFLDIKKKWGCL